VAISDTNAAPPEHDSAGVKLAEFGGLVLGDSLKLPTVWLRTDLLPTSQSSD
jgi:hypothetical protein